MCPSLIPILLDTLHSIKQVTRSCDVALQQPSLKCVFSLDVLYSSVPQFGAICAPDAVEDFYRHEDEHPST